MVPGETIDHIVIRNSTNPEERQTISERHIAPPKTSQIMAETHGMFDNDSGLKKNVYSMIVEKDNSLKFDTANHPLPEDNDQFHLPYLPDPVANGITFDGLSGTKKSLYKIKFRDNDKWPDVLPFRLKLIERNSSDSNPLEYDCEDGVLTIRLAKAETVEVKISCNILPTSLEEMAIWKLIDSTTSDPILKKMVIDGKHWMITPYRTVKLIHAVDKPLLSPEFQNLRSIRKLGERTTILSDKIPIDGKSTQKLEIHAEWNEIYTDREGEKCTPDVAFEVFIDSDANIVTLFNQHQFQDTKYRKVKYTAKAISRFGDYFPDTTKTELWILSQKAREVDVLNSVRPKIPKILYIIPTLKYGKIQPENPEKEGRIRRKRSGGSFRIYLDGPWYLSGAGELLGIVLWTCSPCTIWNFIFFQSARFC